MERLLLSISKQDPRKLIKSLGWVLLGSLVLSLFSQIAIPVPFSSVPFTMQTIAVFLLGSLMGKKYGTWSVIAFLFQAAAGLPVFGGASCLSNWYVTETAGYLFGFVAAAWLVGALCEKWAGTSLKRLIFANSCGALLILFCGWAWLCAFISAKDAFYAGVLPFFFADIVKAVSAALITQGFTDYKKHKVGKQS